LAPSVKFLHAVNPKSNIKIKPSNLKEKPKLLKSVVLTNQSSILHRYTYVTNSASIIASGWS